jgi:integrase
MMSDAVLEGLIGASPCREIDLPRVVRPEPRWLLREEYDRIQMALASQPRAEVWQPFVALGCFSGLRPGELAGLDVEHFDLDRSMVRVQQVMTRHGLRAYPKSDSSVRSVPFPDEEVGVMLWRLLGDRGSGPAFTTAEGARVDDRNFARRVWAPALASAGVGQVRPYVMRHSCASWLVQKGVPEYEIAKMLGHSTTRLVSVYAHLAPERHDRIRLAWGVSDPQVPHAETQESPSPSGLGL